MYRAKIVRKAQSLVVVLAAPVEPEAKRWHRRAMTLDVLDTASSRVVGQRGGMLEEQRAIAAKVLPAGWSGAGSRCDYGGLTA